VKPALERIHQFLAAPLGGGTRGMLVLCTLLLIAAYLFPLWSLTMFAPQYPEGLRLFIYSYKLDGANNGQDVKEVNVLNHYIGMRDLASSDFTEFKWIPFVVGALGLLFLRAAVLGTVSRLVDVVVMYLYFSLFSLWSFGYKLYAYGHNLDPTAAVQVPPFMPPLFGYKKLANFEVYSYPGLGSYALGLVSLLLIGTLLVVGLRQRGSAAGRPAA
jgi:hypothetical protein